MTPMNPEPGRILLENQEHTIASIKDTVTGTTTSFPVKQELILLNPSTGERGFQTTVGLERGIDGRLLTPEASLVCRECGRGPYAGPGIAYCNDCQTTIGRQCCVKDQALPVCKSCRRKRFWRRAGEWLTSIGGTRT